MNKFMYKFFTWGWFAIALDAAYWHKDWKFAGVAFAVGFLAVNKRWIDE